MSVSAVSSRAVTHSTAIRSGEEANGPVLRPLLEPLRRVVNSADFSGVTPYVVLGAGATITVLTQKIFGWGFRPKLRVSFSSEEPRYNEEVDGTRWFRFKITNKGLDTAVGVVAEVQRVYREEGGKKEEDTAFRTTVLQSLRKEEELDVKDTDIGIDLHRDQCEYWGLINKPIDGEAFAISTYRNMVHKRMGKPIEFPPGTYVLDVYAFARRQRAKKAEFRVINMGKEGISVERVEKEPLFANTPAPIPRFGFMPVY